MLELRPATRADISEMSRIHARSWKAAYLGLIPQAYLDELREDLWVPLFEQSLCNGTEALLALCENLSIGCATYCAARDEALAGWGEVPSIYVLPEYFHGGTGTLLLQGAFDGLRDKGYSQAYLWVLESNLRARAFYEHLGMSWNGDTMPLEILGEQLTELRYTITL